MAISIPFFSLKRQWKQLKPKLAPIIERVFDSQCLIGGKEVELFEKSFAEYLNVKHVISCNSGTDALWLALKGLKIKENEIVLTTPFSFIASSSEIVAHNAHPVFIDIDEKTYNISPYHLEKWLTSNAIIDNGKALHKKLKLPISGILAVNIFGQCADYDRIKEIAKKWNLWIIEDAAQSVGSNVQNNKSGTFGDIATFSFYPTKNLGALGDAGAVCTNNDDLAKRVLSLRNHGRFSKYEYLEYGINSRMDAIQAAVLKEKLTLIDSWNERRRTIASKYTKAISSYDFIQQPHEEIGYHSYHQYCIRSTKRLEIQQYLEKNLIGSNIFYPQPLNTIPFLQTHKELNNPCPIAHKVSQEIFSLPIWPELTDQEVDSICTYIHNFCAQEQISSTTTPDKHQNMQQGKYA
jgi:dTDP-4-amino-4,6-dideoxygalactose transaminase